MAERSGMEFNCIRKGNFGTKKILKNSNLLFQLHGSIPKLEVECDFRIISEDPCANKTHTTSYENTAKVLLQDKNVVKIHESP